ncbi:MAG: hypothetical protein ACLU98_04570 [Desulfovibrio fairfieldensis]
MSLLATIYAPGKLLVSIVGRNQGDWVVEAAKKAGARGGTVLLGRGTAESRILRLLCLGDTEKDLCSPWPRPGKCPPSSTSCATEAAWPGKRRA